jgi:flagellin-like hook-associated protein FlgL|tara:strand:- start:218 stop:922 length:705 start_codon:yes stop_codon:yes gene_type:complete
MTTTNTSVTDTTNGQLPNGGLDTVVNIVDDYREMFNNAITHSIRHHDAIEEGQQSLAKLKLMGEEFSDAGIANVHQMFVGPKIAHVVQLEDGTFKVTNNVPNPQHLPIDELKVTADGCTATVAEAIAIRSAYFEMVDPSGKMKEIFWTPQDKRKAHFTSMERGMFNEFNKQRDKKLATIYNALKPKSVPKKKTNAEKSINHLDSLINSLDNFDADTTAIKKELEVFRKHLKNLK